MPSAMPRRKREREPLSPSLRRRAVGHSVPSLQASLGLRREGPLCAGSGSLTQRSCNERHPVFFPPIRLFPSSTYLPRISSVLFGVRVFAVSSDAVSPGHMWLRRAVASARRHPRAPGRRGGVTEAAPRLPGGWSEPLSSSPGANRATQPKLRFEGKTPCCVCPTRLWSLLCTRPGRGHRTSELGR